MRTKFNPQYRTELRERIMQSAMENFSKKGFDRTRMEDIAAAAGLAKGTLYLYFKDKEDLLKKYHVRYFPRSRSRSAVNFD